MKPNVEQDSKAWDKHAGVYAEKQSSGSDVNVNLILPAVASAIPSDLSGLTALDVCCGRGLLTEILLERGAKVTAVDFSTELVDQARGRLGSHPKLELIVEDVCRLGQVGIGSFDFIVSNIALQDIYDTKSAIHALPGLCKCGTKVIVSFRHPFNDSGKRSCSYFTENVLINPLQPKWKRKSGIKTYPPRYHRPLMSYLAWFLSAGLNIEEFRELPDPEGRPIAVILKGTMESAPTSVDGGKESPRLS